jgi:protoporphyrinogen oxidase
MKNERVVIIGAGPAGLSAAYELIGKGVRPLVLEKSDCVGGISRTGNYNNYYYDIGGHRFFTKFEKVNRLWHQMLGEDFLKVSRMSRIYYRGRFFKYPLRVFDALIKLGIIESVRIPLSYLKAQVRPIAEESTFDQWVTNRFGRRLYETFFKAYTEKVWGIPCNRIESDWAAQRIKGLSLMSALTNALFGTRNAKTLIDEFNYPLKGPGMMWQRFQEAIVAEGGEVRLNAEGVRLICENHRVQSVVCLENGHTSTIPAEHLISSVPLTQLVAMMAPEAPDNVLEAAGNLSYRAFIIVGLIVDHASLFPDQWIYIHSPKVRVGRIQNFKNWSPAMVPDPAKTCIGMEYFCNEGDETWQMPEKDLIDLAAEELSELGLVTKNAVLDGFVVRQPKAYPIYDFGYEKNLEIIRNFIDRIDNLQTIGRNGMHRYNNMDHSMLTGLMAAQNLLGAAHNTWEINDDQAYLEEDQKIRIDKLIRDKIFTTTFARIDPFAFAVASGCVSGLLFFLATVWLLAKGGEVVGPNLRLFGQYFYGYTVSFKGAFIAFGYSFSWAFILGWLFAYLRNLLVVFYLYRVKKKAEIMSLRDFFDNL